MLFETTLGNCPSRYGSSRPFTFSRLTRSATPAAETLRFARMRHLNCQAEFVECDAYQLPESLGTFDAAFMGFWFSHIPVTRRVDFLRGLSHHLKPGANVVLLDNRYVEGSSSPITNTDVDGNTYQTRRLKDRSTYQVLKNFPSEAELRALLTSLDCEGTYTVWPYFWACEFVARQVSDG